MSEPAEDKDRIERNRDMWKGQCERQAAKLGEMRWALYDLCLMLAARPDMAALMGFAEIATFERARTILNGGSKPKGVVVPPLGMTPQAMDTAPHDGPILVWWPIVSIDADTGTLTDQPVGGQWLCTEWNGGQWLEPDCLNGLNSTLFDDDREYAEQPFCWVSLPAALTPGAKK